MTISHATGIARVTAYPEVRLWAEDHCNAFIEIDLEPTARPHAVEVLSRIPQVVSISVISSGRDLFLTVLVPDLATLSHVVLHRLHGLPGLRRTRTHTVTTVYGEGNHWRLGALDPRQRARAVPPCRPTASGVVWKPHHREVLRALDDGRRPAAGIAARTGNSGSTVRRWLNEMVAGRLLSLRCEVAQPITGWPIAVTFWARVPPDEPRDCRPHPHRPRRHVASREADGVPARRNGTDHRGRAHRPVGDTVTEPSSRPGPEA